MSRFDDLIEGGEGTTLNQPMYEVLLDEAIDPPTLTLIFKDDLGRDKHFDCNRMLCLEHTFAVAFAHGFAVKSLPDQITSRASNLGNLESGIFKWIKANYAQGEIGFEQFTGQLLTDFDHWLLEKNLDGNLRFKTYTGMKYRGIVRAVLEEIRRGPWKDRLRDDSRVPKGLYGVAGHKTSVTKPYDLETLGRILRAIRTDTKDSIRRLKNRENLLQYGRAAAAVADGQLNPSALRGLPCLTEDENHKAVLLARLQQTFGPILPTLASIKHLSKNLYDQIQDYGSNEIFATLHPFAGDLLPFSYQLAVLTAFNTGPLYDLKLGLGIKTVRILGVERVVFSSFKGRLKKYVTASYVETDRELSAPFIARAIAAWTADIRHAAAPHLQDDLWLYVPRHNAGSREVRSMRLNDTGALNPDANNAVTAFSKKYDLERVVISRIRATLAEVAHDLFGGDLRATMDFLQHTNPETTLKNYTNGLSLARHHGIIADVQQLRERFIFTEGKLDPRVLAQSGDPAAATPGWQCANPYSSPMPGERVGRLCRSYGSCPICPLARVDVTSPVAYARLRQVKAGLESARSTALPERWTQGLAPILRQINQFWILCFPDQVKRVGEQLNLKPIVPFD